MKMKVVKWCRKKWNDHNMMYIYHKQCEIKQKNRWNSSNGQIPWFPIDFQWKCYRDLKHPTSRKNFTAVLGQNHALIHTQCLNLLKCSFFIWDLPWLNGGPTASDCFQISDEIGSRQSNLSQNVVSYQRDLMAGRLRVVVCSLLRCVA